MLSVRWYHSQQTSSEEVQRLNLRESWSIHAFASLDIPISERHIKACRNLSQDRIYKRSMIPRWNVVTRIERAKSRRSISYTWSDDPDPQITTCDRGKSSADFTINDFESRSDLRLEKFNCVAFNGSTTRAQLKRRNMKEGVEQRWTNISMSSHLNHCDLQVRMMMIVLLHVAYVNGQNAARRAMYIRAFDPWGNPFRFITRKYFDSSRLRCCRVRLWMLRVQFARLKFKRVRFRYSAIRSAVTECTVVRSFPFPLNDRTVMKEETVFDVGSVPVFECWWSIDIFSGTIANKGYYVLPSDFDSVARKDVSKNALICSRVPMRCCMLEIPDHSKVRW